MRQSNQIEKFVVANLAHPQHHTIDLNIKGTFFLTRAAVPHMGKGSSIIVTASQVAYAGPPSLIDYTMTKAAQVGMVRGLSNQLIGKGIRVNAVAPGPVRRPLNVKKGDCTLSASFVCLFYRRRSTPPCKRQPCPRELFPSG